MQKCGLENMEGIEEKSVEGNKRMRRERRKGKGTKMSGKRRYEERNEKRKTRGKGDEQKGIKGKWKRLMKCRQRGVWGGKRGRKG